MINADALVECVYPFNVCESGDQNVEKGQQNSLQNRVNYRPQSVTNLFQGRHENETHLTNRPSETTSELLSEIRFNDLQELEELETFEDPQFIMQKVLMQKETEEITKASPGSTDAATLKKLKRIRRKSQKRVESAVSKIKHDVETELEAEMAAEKMQLELEMEAELDAKLENLQSKKAPKKVRLQVPKKKKSPIKKKSSDDGQPVSKKLEKQSSEIRQPPSTEPANEPSENKPPASKKLKKVSSERQPESTKSNSEPSESKPPPSKKLKKPGSKKVKNKPAEVRRKRKTKKLEIKDTDISPPATNSVKSKKRKGKRRNSPASSIESNQIVDSAPSVKRKLSKKSGKKKVSKKKSKTPVSDPIEPESTAKN